MAGDLQITMNDGSYINCKDIKHVNISYFDYVLFEISEFFYR